MCGRASGWKLTLLRLLNAHERAWDLLALPRLTPKLLWPITSVVETLAIFAYLFHGLVNFAVLLIDLGVTIVLISGRRPTDAARGGPLGIGSRRSG